MTEWMKYPKNKPPLNEFVEVIYKDGNRITDLNRDFAAYYEDDERYYWTHEGMDERDWSEKGFPITHWRRLTPDHRNRRPFLVIGKNGRFDVKVKRVKDD